jgi:hypothetical protein
MRRHVIPHHLAVFHYKSNALKLGNIGDRISGNGNKISEFPGLNRAHTILPAEHFQQHWP